MLAKYRFEEATRVTDLRYRERKISFPFFFFSPFFFLFFFSLSLLLSSVNVNYYVSVEIQTTAFKRRDEFLISIIRLVEATMTECYRNFYITLVSWNIFLFLLLIHFFGVHKKFLLHEFLFKSWNIFLILQDVWFWSVITIIIVFLFRTNLFFYNDLQLIIL